MSVQFKVTIPEELMQRLAHEPGSIQSIILRALHLLAYGSPVEQRLINEIEWFRAALLDCKGMSPPPPSHLASEKELGW